MGRRYVDLFKVFVWAGICLFVGPAFVALLTAPWHPSLADYLRCVLAYELFLGLVAGAQLVVDLQRQACELQGSRARIVAASDAARRQVERDLHDGAQQGLLLLRLKLERAPVP
jgi:hypothetical protein